MRIVTKMEDGSIVVEDTLSLEEEKQRRIAEFKEIISKELLALYPHHKQINASLGIYSKGESDKIKSAINQVRDKVTMFEAMVKSCTTSDDLAGNFDILPVLGEN